jgi:CheY-like chemotaxis protein
VPLQERRHPATAAVAPWVWRDLAPQWIFAFPSVEGAPLPDPETPSSPPREARARLRVLVVEDNRDAAESLRDLMDALGYEVAVAYTGTEGVSAAVQFLPHVVLCDLGLPELDGYAVGATLKRNPVTAPARLIAITGYSRDEDRRRSQEAGFEVHLVKPVDLDELERLLAGVADAVHPDAAAEETQAG